MTEILCINVGSSSVKAALFDGASPEPRLVRRGRVERLGHAPVLWLDGEKRQLSSDIAAAEAAALLTDGICEAGTVREVGHRIACGGAQGEVARSLDRREVARLSALSVFAPLHQRVALEAVETLRRHLPEAEHIGCFDTAFHASMPAVASVLPLPVDLRDLGLRKLGYHGLSFAFIADWLATHHPSLAGRRTIIAHLGSGSSLCALIDGMSVATTMGMTPLDGLPMGTRTGRLDPGVLLFLLGQYGLKPAEVEDLLYRQSGLEGLSGIGADLRDIQASDSPEARLAIDYFVLRAAEEIAGLTAHLGGLDTLVFTGGIGANDPGIREKIIDRIRHLGPFEVFATPTNEEQVMAKEVRRLMDQEISR